MVHKLKLKVMNEDNIDEDFINAHDIKFFAVNKYRAFILYTGKKGDD